MAQIDDLIQKIPRPVFVVVVLVIALAVIVSQNPLSDGCGVEIANFDKNVRGTLVGYRTASKKIQYAQIDNLRDICKDGNSQGSCEDYFKGIRKIADAMRNTPEKCYPQLSQEYVKLIPALQQGIKIMALTAWGIKPPENLAQRLGWLTESDIYGFCRAKNLLIKTLGPEAFKNYRMSIYQEFPNEWPEKMSLEKRSEANRPRALRYTGNPSGALDEKDIYEKSIFSLRCDLYQ